MSTLTSILDVEMGYAAKWLKHRIAFDGEALVCGHGCHPKEAKSLQLFLENGSTADEAAVAITTPVLDGSDPLDEVYSLMTLLCEALVDLKDDREKLFNLLACIQALPPARGIDWSQPRGFGSVWSELYRGHIHGQYEWGGLFGLFEAPESEPTKEALGQHYAEIATLEAEMYVRGLGGVTARWGYETLDLIGRWGADIFVTGVIAWLRVAGGKLKQDLQLEEIKSWGSVNTQHTKNQAQLNTIMPHYWERWAAQVREMSNYKHYSKEARKLAAECYKSM
jgi:hypothetical protein